ncbi:MAG: GNAT family N-acetyltransferase [Hyphomonadaceae bacterium]
MLSAARTPILTPRLELRRTRIEDASTMFEALRHSETYTFLPRAAPRSPADVATHFARVIQETAPGRREQWLNWTVWRRDIGLPLGTVEASVDPARSAAIGYLFDPRCWRRGYGREAVAAMLDHLSACGAASFDASIDVRNIASQRLAAALGFTHASTTGIDQIWRRDADLR